MIYEITGIECKRYEDNIIYILRKDKSEEYTIYNLHPTAIMVGAFFNENEEVIGINIFSNTDIYSIKKIKEMIENKTAIRLPHTGILKEWWNKEIYNSETETEYDDYEDIYLKFEELEQYFIKTVEENKHEPDSRWIEYYLNPPCGLGIKINETLFSYSSQNIKKFKIYEEGERKTIYCYDQNDSWVEDIDIITTESYENIKFLFEYGDLKHSNTTDEEQEAYIKLHNSLSPWNSTDKNRELFQEWTEYFKKYAIMSENKE